MITPLAMPWNKPSIGLSDFAMSCTIAIVMALNCRSLGSVKVCQGSSTLPSIGAVSVSLHRVCVVHRIRGIDHHLRMCRHCLQRGGICRVNPRRAVSDNPTARKVYGEPLDFHHPVNCIVAIEQRFHSVIECCLMRFSQPGKNLFLRHSCRDFREVRLSERYASRGTPSECERESGREHGENSESGSFHARGVCDASITIVQAVIFYVSNAILCGLLEIPLAHKSAAFSPLGKWGWCTKSVQISGPLNHTASNPHLFSRPARDVVHRVTAEVLSSGKAG